MEGQTGIIKPISDKTLTDKIDFGTSLKDYYIKNNMQKFIKNSPYDSPVIEVDVGKINLSFYPQALKPFINREILLKLYPKLSKEIDKYIKLNMQQRLEIDKEFIIDICIIKK